MWIMLNNRPLDVSKIEGISEVIKIDIIYCVKQLERKHSGVDTEIDINIIRKILLKNDYSTLKDLKNKAEKDNVIFGYIFYIKECVMRQKFLNGVFNGIENKINKRYSKLYSTEEAAKANLEHLLFEINEIYNKLVKVEI